MIQATDTVELALVAEAAEQREPAPGPATLASLGSTPGARGAPSSAAAPAEYEPSGDPHPHWNAVGVSRDEVRVTHDAVVAALGG